MRIDIPPHVAEIIRQLPPDLKRSVKQALRVLSDDPGAGEPLRRELDGLWKYRVRRYRIVYAPDRTDGRIRVYAVGHLRAVYEVVAAQLQSQTRKGPHR